MIFLQTAVHLLLVFHHALQTAQFIWLGIKNYRIIILERYGGSVGRELFSENLPVATHANKLNIESWLSLEIAASCTCCHTATFVSYLSRLHS
jgi:hypothetical protein